MNGISFSGIIRKVNIINAPPGSKWKRRAMIMVESEKGSLSIGTFKDKDIIAASQYNGQKVTLEYLENGQYNNLVEGSINPSGVQNPPQQQVTEEFVRDKEEPPMEIVQQKGEQSAPIPTKQNVVNYNNTVEERRQTLICRQNSWSQANAYLQSLLKAIELGIIHVEEFDKEQLNLTRLIDIAHKIELDVMR
jgi:hypothetical protein